MTAIRVWLRAILRQRWRATIILSLLIGIGGAAAIGAADGARRTQTAFPRMRQSTRAGDLLVAVYGDGISRFYDVVGKLPVVESYGKVAGVPLIGAKTNGDPDPQLAANALAAEDDAAFNTIARPKLIAGRLFNPAAPDEIIMNPVAARSAHVRVGSILHWFIGNEADQRDVSHVIPVTLRVVGIVVSPDDVVPTTFLDAAGQIYLNHAFIQASPTLQKRENLNYDGVFLLLKPGANVSALEAKANELAPKYPETFGGTFIQNQAQAAERVQRAILPLATALYAFAGLVGIAVLFVIGQAIARQQFVEGGDYGTLRALGFTRSQIVALSLLRVAMIAGIGAVIAAGLSLAVSPFMPIGPARIAEPAPGFEVNVPIVLVGAFAILILLIARALIPAFRVASVGTFAREGGRKSVIADAAARAGAAPTTSSGIRMAFEQKRGAASLPLRSALAGTIAGLAALVVAVIFGSTLNRLVTDPHQYGWRWDAIVDSSFGVFPYKTLGTSLREDHRVSGLTAGNYGEAVIGGRDVPAIGLDMKKGNLYPMLLGDGRPAVAPGEIVLGTTTMRRIHAHIGSSVSVTIFGKERRMVVVGRAVFPSMGRGSFAPVSLGDGVAVIASSLPQLEESGNLATGDNIYNFVLVSANNAADRQVLLEDLKEHFLVGPCVLTNDCNLTLSARPLELGVLATEVRAAPLVLAGLLALFAIAAMAHAILTSVRMRARDLAVLKTIGFVTRQIRATVAWQTSVLAVTALLLGLPLGVIAGRAIWSRFADGLGVPPGAVVPVVILLVTIPATLLLANVIAAFPARVAARTEAAVVLRTE